MLDRFVLYLSIVLTSLSFVILSDGISNDCSIASQVCIAVLFVKALFKLIIRQVKVPKTISIWFTMVLVSFLLYMLYADSPSIILADIRQIFLPLAITFSSYVIFYNKQGNFERTFIFLCLFTAICSLYALASSGGFTIMALYRDGIVKNQTAPYFAQFCIIAFLTALNTNKRALSVLMLITAFSLLAYPVVLRARTATLGTLFIIAFAFIKKYRIRVVYLIPILCGILLISFGDEINKIFESSIIGNVNASDLDSISSGRLSRNESSFSHWMGYFFFGTLSTFNQISSQITNNSYLIPHLFLLWTLVKYGLIGSLPFIIVYFINFFTAIKIYKSDYKKNQFMFLCLALSYIISLAEYSAPFGPGSSFILTYILFGISIKDYHKSKQSNRTFKHNMVTEG